MAYVLDSGFLYAQVNGKDHWHTAVSAASPTSEKIIFPVPAITEVTFLLQRDLGSSAVAEFIDTLSRTDISLAAPTFADYNRSAEILRTYHDANIDFVDACIVAIAERLNITKILTVDRRHFSLFRPKHCVAFEILP